MVEALLAFALCYVLFGCGTLAYELVTDDEAAGDLRERGWPLALLVILGWPAFVWQVLRDEL